MNRSKISRLPRIIREQLNCRLDDGQPGDKILRWLNGMDKVRKIMKEHFGSMPVSKQNLSEWHNGPGFREWLTHQEALALASDIAEDGEEFACITGEGNLVNRISDWFAVKYLVMAKAVIASVEKLDPAEQEAPMRRLCRDLVALRRADHSAERLRIEKERFEMELEQVEYEKLKEEFDQKCFERNFRHALEMQMGDEKDASKGNGKGKVRTRRSSGRKAMGCRKRTKAKKTPNNQHPPRPIRQAQNPEPVEGPVEMGTPNSEVPGDRPAPEGPEGSGCNSQRIVEPGQG